MAAKHESILHTLAATVGLGGTFNVSYPSGKGARDYIGGDDHFIVGPGQTLFAKAGDFSVRFDAANIVVTLTNGRAGMVLGSKIGLNLDRAELLDAAQLAADIPASVAFLQTLRVNLGKPIAAAAAGIVASQAATLASGLATGMTGAVAGVVTLDVPRALVAAWTGAAVLTIVGTDAFGKAMRESSAAGTSFTGKKAFKTITSITVSADVTALTVGTGKVLGLPVFLGEAIEVLKEVQDGVAAAAGTIVVGDPLVATATTGDVRGTYAPSVNPDGTKAYELIVAVRSPEAKGIAQF